MSSSPVRAVTLTSLDALREWQPRLDELLQSCEQSEFFNTSVWLIQWCETYLKPGDLIWCHAFTCGDQLIGFAPFYRKSKSRLLGEELHFIGEGEPEAVEVSSEYQDIVILPPFAAACLSILADSVTHLSSLNSLVFKNVLSGAHVEQWLTRYLPVTWRASSRVLGSRYRIQVAPSKAAQVSAFPGSRVRRQARKWLNNDSSLQVRQCHDEHALPLFFDSLKQLHQSEWAKRGQTTAMSQADFVDFHLNLAKRLIQQQRLVLFTLHHHHELIAVFYGWTFKQTLYYYQSGVKRLDSGPAAGIAMHLAALNIARKSSIFDYDLMIGDETSYKGDFASSGQTMVQLNAYRGFAKWLARCRLWYRRRFR
ncbi:GNAT family N-acetyltransferase [Alteromonas oceanisediminis]|uniref:GNAT family N-acetyltransferase n=1 Tax=Alteromonas oceanisediminis TaxID=2836180 RepID=UPI001BDAD9CB|nr:GNAT family N-acetyltransferase [Alteromonas oceanisediminis]MBT0585667.1 GNAT family N-acetyltransferase [Alteromonas oceanisediminis]